MAAISSPVSDIENENEEQGIPAGYPTVFEIRGCGKVVATGIVVARAHLFSITNRSNVFILESKQLHCSLKPN